MSGYAANAIQTAALTLYFNGAATSLINSSSTASTNIWVSLHIADPTAAGNQASSEATYTSYARIVTGRTTALTGWAVTGNSPASASPLTAVTFPQCTTSTTIVITNFGVGTSSSGAGVLWFSGPVTQNISINTGVTPSLTTGTAITCD